MMLRPHLLFALAAILLSLVVLIPMEAEAQSPQLCPSIINDGIGLTRYCRTRSIYNANDTVTRAIILVPGSDRNARDYYDTVEDIAVNTLHWDMNTLDIVAVQFHIERDFTAFPSDLDERYYRFADSPTAKDSHNWNYGGNALNKTASAFGVVDHVVRRLLENRENLEHIVIAGQSAGGRFVTRYAVGMAIPMPSGKSISFWSANAGLYMWLDDEDLIDQDTGTPGLQPADVIDYGYGVNKRSWGYMAGVTDSEIRYRTFNRRIWRTVGANDTDPEGTADAALAQGTTRHQRHHNYAVHIFNECMETYGATQPNRCSIMASRNFEIPGIGHFHEPSFRSPTGRNILFFDQP